MTPKELHRIERWNYVIGGIFILASAFLFPAKVTLGVAVGALLSCGNFTGIRMLVAASMRAQGSRRAALQLLLIGKMAIMFVLVFLVMKFLPLSPVGLAVGISVFLLSIGIESLRFALGRSSSSSSDEAPDGRA